MHGTEWLLRGAPGLGAAWAWAAGISSKRGEWAVYLAVTAAATAAMANIAALWAVSHWRHRIPQAASRVSSDDLSPTCLHAAVATAGGFAGQTFDD